MKVFCAFVLLVFVGLSQSMPLDYFPRSFLLRDFPFADPEFPFHPFMLKNILDDYKSGGEPFTLIVVKDSGLQDPESKVFENYKPLLSTTTESSLESFHDEDDLGLLLGEEDSFHDDDISSKESWEAKIDPQGRATIPSRSLETPFLASFLERLHLKTSTTTTPSSIKVDN